MWLRDSGADCFGNAAGLGVVLIGGCGGADGGGDETVFRIPGEGVVGVWSCRESQAVGSFFAVADGVVLIRHGRWRLRSCRRG